MLWESTHRRQTRKGLPPSPPSNPGSLVGYSLIRHFNILFIMDFCLNFDFEKHCIKIGFLLITEVLGTPCILRSTWVPYTLPPGAHPGPCKAISGRSTGPDQKRVFLSASQSSTWVVVSALPLSAAWLWENSQLLGTSVSSAIK